MTTMHTNKELTEKEIRELKTIGIIVENWYAVQYDKNSMPFAIFNSKEYAEAYRDQFCATAIIEPYGMKIKDYRK